MTFARAFVVLLIAVAMLSSLACGKGAGGTGTDPRPTPTTPLPFDATFREAPCSFALPAGQVDGNTVRCGTVTVLEDRSHPAGNTIEIAVAVLEATAGNAAPDPLFYLSGGPGAASLEGDLQRFTLDFADPLQRGRDIVFFDQRGTGRSEPSLTCDELDGVPVDDDAAYRRALAVCHDRLLADCIDLDAYDSAASAADVPDIADALGYGAYNLYGVSYGTRLALTAMRDAPSRIRSVVLDSPLPPQANLYADTAVAWEEALSARFDACSSDAACRAFAPDLRTTFFAAVEQLNAQPVTVAPDVTVDGTVFIETIIGALHVPELIVMLPATITAVAGGDVAPLTPLVSGGQGADPTFALGMNLSVQCAEEVPFNTADRVRAPSDAYTRLAAAGEVLLQTARDDCGAWHVAQSPLSENEPVARNHPVLVLSGGFDPTTPRSYALDTVASLDRALLLQFESSSHGVLDAGCPMDVVAAFVDDPADSLDDLCVAGMPPIAFTP